MSKTRAINKVRARKREGKWGETDIRNRYKIEKQIKKYEKRKEQI